MVHRDIKPSNILLIKDKDVQIAHFSIAQITKLDNTITELQGVMGPAKYMLPEQLREEKITSQSDFFPLA
jgi:serine/threonine protein kinase